MKWQVPLVSLMSGLFAASAAQADMISFEGLAAGTDISTLFEHSDGVIFSSTTAGSGGPKVGGFATSMEGWVYNPTPSTNTIDHLLPGEGTDNGANFITDVIGVKPTSVNVSLHYLSPVASLAFDIFDIDGNQSFVNDPESFSIKIYNSSMTLLDSIDVAAGGIDSFGAAVGDGISSRFAFNRGSNDVSWLVINGFRAHGNFGLGLDNFAHQRLPDEPIPEPATLGLLGLGLLGLGLSRRKRG